MNRAQLAAQHAYEAAHPISIWSASEAQMESWCAARDAAIAAAARAPARTTTAPNSTAVDPIALARAEAVAEAQATTAEVARLCQDAGMPDLFPSLIGATPIAARAAIAARTWDEAWARVDALPAMKTASNSAAADLWSQAFDKADAARLAASPSSTAGSTPATGSTDAGSVWDAAFDAVARR
jgi:hypothetical protein